MNNFINFVLFHNITTGLDSQTKKLLLALGYGLGAFFIWKKFAKKF